MSFMKRNIKIAAAVLMSCASSSVTFAQQGYDASGMEQPGVVRISNRPAPQVGGSQVTQASAFHGHRAAAAPCPTGNCPVDSGSGVAGDPNAYCPTGNCPTGRCPHCWGSRFGHCNGYYCKRSPDYGYTPPAKYPLLQRGVQYSEYYPAQWYGTGPIPAPQAPMVYQPTDTTQLGFYYQHVPFWMPAPYRLPQRPIPAEWNITGPAASAYNFNGYYGGYPRGYGGHLFHHHRRMRYYDNSYGVNGNCPVDGTMVPQQASPTTMNSQQVVPSTQGPPVPVEVQVPDSASPLPGGSGQILQDDETDDLPPSPINEGRPRFKTSPQTDSASSGHIRRLGYSF